VTGVTVPGPGVTGDPDVARHIIHYSSLYPSHIRKVKSRRRGILRWGGGQRSCQALSATTSWHTLQSYIDPARHLCLIDLDKVQFIQPALLFLLKAPRASRDTLADLSGGPSDADRGTPSLVGMRSAAVCLPSEGRTVALVLIPRSGFYA